MTELIITKTERLRMHEDQRIAAEFQAMRAAYPDAATSRIVRSLAASGKFKSKSFAGIRSALLRTGTINTSKRN